MGERPFYLIKNRATLFSLLLQCTPSCHAVELETDAIAVRKFNETGKQRQNPKYKNQATKRDQTTRISNTSTKAWEVR